MSAEADNYLQSILNREAVNSGPNSPVRSVQSVIQPMIAQWAGNHLLSVAPSGSFMKGTANLSGTDIDFFISLSPNVTETLKEIYESLFKKLSENGYSPKRQNVSVNVTVGGYSVDLVPAKRQGGFGTDHSLYRRRGDTWTKTNVTTHIAHVQQYARLSESRILKLWRDQKGLDFPSFYLELSVIAGLPWGFSPATLSGNVWKVFQYLSDGFSNARVVDPANTNNIISDDLSAAEKAKIRATAERAVAAKNWNEIVA